VQHFVEVFGRLMGQANRTHSSRNDVGIQLDTSGRENIRELQKLIERA